MRKKTTAPNRITVHTGGQAPLQSYQRQQKARRKFRQSNRPLVVLGVVLALVFFCSAALYAPASYEHWNVAYLRELSGQKFTHFVDFVLGRGAEGGIQFTTWRYIMMTLCGAALAAAGAVYQGVFRNLLASPTTLGVQAGGSLGNLIYVLCFLNTAPSVIRYSAAADVAESATLWDRNLQQLLVLLGCLGAVALVAGVTNAAGRGRIQSSHLILAGVLFSSVISSFTMMVQYYLLLANPYDTRITVIRSLTMGSFDRAYTLEHLGLMAVFLVPCLAVLLLLSRRMDLMALGEEQAASMGVNSRLVRNVVIFINTLMCAVVIAFCGQIGFVGFIVPLAARRLVGHSFPRVLTASLLLGGTLMILVYDVALATGMTNYIGLFTGVLGSAVMIFAFVRERGMAYER